MREDVDNAVWHISRMTPKELTEMMSRLLVEAPEARSYIHSVLGNCGCHHHFPYTIGSGPTAVPLPYVTPPSSTPVWDGNATWGAATATSGYMEPISPKPDTGVTYYKMNSTGLNDAVTGC